MSDELKPAGLETPEGVKRVRKAVDRHAQVTSSLCSALVSGLRHKGTIEQSLNHLGLSKDFIELVKQLVAAHAAAQEECMRAVCNHPPADGADRA